MPHPSVQLLTAVLLVLSCLGEASEVQLCAEIERDLTLPEQDLKAFSFGWSVSDSFGNNCLADSRFTLPAEIDFSADVFTVYPSKMVSGTRGFLTLQWQWGGSLVCVLSTQSLLAFDLVALIWSGLWASDAGPVEK